MGKGVRSDVSLEAESVRARDAVRAYFDELEALRPCSPLCASYLATANERREAVLSRLGITGSRCIVDRIDVVHAGEGVALVGVKASHEVVAESPLGAQKDVERFDGPWVLHQVEGTWKTTAFTISGRSTLDSSHVRASGGASSDDVSVEVLQVNLRPDSTLVFLELANGRRDPVRFGAVSMSRGWRTTRGSFIDELAVAPGDRTIAAASVPGRFPPGSDTLRMKVSAKAPGRGRIALGPIEVSLGPSGRRVLQEEGLEVPAGV